VVDLRANNFKRWLANREVVEDQAPVAADDPMTIIYSSGTTGTPKGIVQPHRYRSMIMKNAIHRGYTDDTVTLLATPLYSNTTLSALVQTISAGGTTVLMAKFDAAEWLRLAERWGATNTMLVPVMYQRLLAHPDFATTDLSSFRMKFCTSAPFAIALKREVLARWPGILTEIYSLTEGGHSSSCTHMRIPKAPYSRPGPRLAARCASSTPTIEMCPSVSPVKSWAVRRE